MQKLSHMHTPIPPSAHVTRLSVPLSCCEDAARVLIELFGGEREATRILGGVRWWQVRAGADQGCVFVLGLFILWMFDGSFMTVGWMPNGSWKRRTGGNSSSTSRPASRGLPLPQWTAAGARRIVQVYPSLVIVVWVGMVWSMQRQMRTNPRWMR